MVAPEMTQTHIVLVIDHRKPLPADLTDMVANRVYTLLYSRGVEAGVQARVEMEVKEQ